MSGNLDDDHFSEEDDKGMAPDLPHKPPKLRRTASSMSQFEGQSRKSIKTTDSKDRERNGSIKNGDYRDTPVFSDEGPSPMGMQHNCSTPL